MSELDDLRDAWLREQDGETGNLYGEALEAAGRTDEAADVYRSVIDLGYLNGFSDLAWLENERGNRHLAIELMQARLLHDTDPDDETPVLRGVLGGWMWLDRDTDAESHLRAGADTDPDVRADLALLLRATDREAEAEELLRLGIRLGERESYLPLGNLLDETGRAEEAEAMYVEGYRQGDAFCAYNMSLMLYEQGRDEDARDWMLRAAEGGDEWAIRALEDDD